MWNDNKFKKNRAPTETMTDLCARAVNDFATTKVERGQFGALVAYGCDAGYQLCEFAVRDLQPELKSPKIWFVAMGSGQFIVDPFLGLLRRVFWKEKQPNLTEGKFATTWALQHAVDLNPGGIKDPIHLAVIDKSGARMLEKDEIMEHLNSVQAAEDYLANYSKLLSAENPPKIPDV
jgi:hypothetical protein